jgi:uncharacterized membrane protein YgcG
MDYQPLIADIDNNGKNEIIIFSNSSLKILNSTLDLIDENTVGDLLGQPTLFNFDSDSLLEVMFISNISSTHYFLAYEYNNSNFIQEFNFTVTNGGEGSGIKCLNLNGTNSCVFKDNSNYVHIVNMGSETNISYNTSMLTNTKDTVPAIADIDADGNVEAVFWQPSTDGNNYGLLAFDLNNRSTDWNVDFLFKAFSTNFVLKGHPVLVDLNNDGKLEIAASVFYDDSSNVDSRTDWFTELFVYNSSGNKSFSKCEESAASNCNDVTSGSTRWEGTNPFVLNVNDSGTDDICFIKDKKVSGLFTNMTINCYNYSGNLILDSEILPSTDTVKTATVADMNNDSEKEILTENYIYAQNGSPIFSYGFNFNFAIPADVDVNNVLDLILSKEGQTKIFKEDISTTQETLLEKYAPILYFHPDEQFFPTTIEAMLNESDLKENDPILDDLIQEMPVSVENLSASGVTDEYFLDMRNASGGLAIFTLPNSSRFFKYNNNVYGRQFEPNENYIVIQYWFFYPYNNWRNNHEGDWEMIQIILNKSINEPQLATYSYHHDAETVNWTQIEKFDSSHPKVFTAQGGHASYWNTSERRYNGFLENLSNGGPVLFPQNNYTLNIINDNTSWVDYLGIWGEKNSILGTSGPQSPANLSYGDQPNRWNNPIEFAEDAKPSQTIANTGSPVNLHAYDVEGNHVGLNESGGIEAEIPGTYLYISSNDSSELIVILNSGNITFIVNATDSGAFNLSIVVFNRNTSTQINTTYNDIQITNTTAATINITPLNPNFVMTIDYDADGIIDNTTLPDNQTGNITSIEIDSDNDSYADSIDNCPNLYNPNKIFDFDNDGSNNSLCGGNDCDDNDASKASDCSSSSSSASGSSGGGSSGGGGGGVALFICNQDWQCGEWSSCFNWIQTRECDFVKVNQYTQNTPCPAESESPEKSRSCEIAAGKPVISPITSTQAKDTKLNSELDNGTSSNKQGLSAITGGVTGIIETTGGKIAAATIIIGLVAIFLYQFLFKK